jgi:hypothetical protein
MNTGKQIGGDSWAASLLAPCATSGIRGVGKLTAHQGDLT